ncbi:class I SAM-dependent methyltransferase [Maribacter sp. 2308TA10-17]|uniref:class I SAM-dependent methyltransferase n=1 Tax=Maribacter sp. 2308TA10-17 TaxID=3386276 RepID=UPI0039BD2DF4
MSKTIEKRLEDEQKFHNEIFETEKRTEEVGRFYAINDAIHDAYEGFVFEKPEGKVYLEYGCGMAKGGRSTRLARLGAKVHGIDISDYAIDFLTKEAEEENLDIDYQVMNAEDMSFEDNYFDVIYGTGILHHLDLDKSFESIARKLKKEGTGIFIEPLGHNPLINGFRDKTPDIRTEDEHPLLMPDFKLAKKYFGKVDVQYFYLTTLGVPILFKKKQPKFLINFCNGFDKVLFTLLPFLRKHAWQVVVKFSDPV